MNKFKRENGILLEPAEKGPLGTRNGAQGIVDFLLTLQIWESRALMCIDGDRGDSQSHDNGNFQVQERKGQQQIFGNFYTLRVQEEEDI